MKDDLRSSMAAAVVDSQGDTSVEVPSPLTLSFSVKAVQELWPTASHRQRPDLLLAENHTRPVE